MPAGIRRMQTGGRAAIRAARVGGALTAAAGLLLAGTASAKNGVTELNQACATLTGCMPGDAPGFPIQIDPGRPTSYVLTSNLVVPTEQNGILIRASGVTIDMNGFGITGPNLVTFPSTCSAGSVSASGYAIHADPSLTRGVAVHDGYVRGMGEGGISLGGSSSHVSRVIAEHNCGNGLYVGIGSIVSESIARSNALNGILASPSTKIEASLAEANGANGIRINEGRSIVESSVSNSNFRDGILSGQRSLVRGCMAMSNGGDGIELDVDGYAVESSASGNGGYGVNGVGLGAGVGSMVARSNSLGDFNNTTLMTCVVRSGSTQTSSLVCN